MLHLPLVIGSYRTWLLWFAIDPHTFHVIFVTATTSMSENSVAVTLVSGATQILKGVTFYGSREKIIMVANNWQLASSPHKHCTFEVMVDIVLIILMSVS